MTESQPEILFFPIPDTQEGARLDAVVSELSGLSRARVQKLCQEGLCGQRQARREKHPLKVRGEIRVELPPLRPLEVEAPEYPLGDCL